MSDSAEETQRPSRDESADTGTASSSSGTSGASGQGSGTGPAVGLVQSILTHYSQNISDAFLMVTRVLTILFSILFLLPFAGGSSFYKKVLIANAATSALRLHQRLPRIQLTPAFLSQLVAEDSCHYLLYSVIFLASFPITLVLVPLSLFATLHVASASLILLDKTGNRSSPVGGILASLIERHQRNVLLAVAMAEVLLMPFVVLSVFTGVCTLVTPFIYSRFLIWRYASRRNPYTRTSFRQIRLMIEQLISLPACPLFVRRGLHSAIDITCRLAPVVPADGQ